MCCFASLIFNSSANERIDSTLKSLISEIVCGVANNSIVCCSTSSLKRFPLHFLHSIFLVVPRPLQAAHQPSGLLNEKTSGDRLNSSASFSRISLKTPV